MRLTTLVDWLFSFFYFFLRSKKSRFIKRDEKLKVINDDEDPPQHWLDLIGSTDVDWSEFDVQDLVKDREGGDYENTVVISKNIVEKKKPVRLEKDKQSGRKIKNILNFIEKFPPKSRQVITKKNITSNTVVKKARDSRKPIISDMKSHLVLSKEGVYIEIEKVEASLTDTIIKKKIEKQEANSVEQSRFIFPVDNKHKEDFDYRVNNVFSTSMKMPKEKKQHVSEKKLKSFWREWTDQKGMNSSGDESVNSSESLGVKAALESCSSSTSSYSPPLSNDLFSIQTSSKIKYHSKNFSCRESEVSNVVQVKKNIWPSLKDKEANNTGFHFLLKNTHRIKKLNDEQKGEIWSA